MSDVLTESEFVNALSMIVSAGSFRAPHGIDLLAALDVAAQMDAEWNYGQNPLTQSVWESVTWARLLAICVKWDAKWGDGSVYPASVKAADATASELPTWAELTRSNNDWPNRQEILLFDLNESCRAKITTAYSARDRQHETQRRLNAQHTPAQDAERRRLVARCHAVEKEIAAAETPEKRAAISAKIEDGSWAEEPE